MITFSTKSLILLMSLWCWQPFVCPHVFLIDAILFLHVHILRVCFIEHIWKFIQFQKLFNPNSESSFASEIGWLFGWLFNLSKWTIDQSQFLNICKYNMVFLLDLVFTFVQGKNNYYFLLKISDVCFKMWIYKKYNTVFSVKVVFFVTFLHTM